MQHVAIGVHQDAVRAQERFVPHAGVHDGLDHILFALFAESNEQIAQRFRALGAVTMVCDTDPLRLLKAKLAEIKEREHLEKISDIKGVQLKIEWGSQIRSYVFMPYTLAKDHRTGYENGNIQAVMDGDIDGFINAYLSMNADKESK